MASARRPVVKQSSGAAAQLRHFSARRLPLWSRSFPVGSLARGPPKSVLKHFQLKVYKVLPLRRAFAVLSLGPFRLVLYSPSRPGSSGQWLVWRVRRGKWTFSAVVASQAEQRNFAAVSSLFLLGQFFTLKCEKPVRARKLAGPQLNSRPDSSLEHEWKARELPRARCTGRVRASGGGAQQPGAAFAFLTRQLARRRLQVGLLLAPPRRSEKVLPHRRRPSGSCARACA